MVDIEIDKVVLEVVVFVDGFFVEIIVEEGVIVIVEEVIVKFVEGVVSGVFVLVVLSESDDSDESSDVFSFFVCCLFVEKGVDVVKVKGIGKNGCIIKEDVEKYFKGGDSLVKVVFVVFEFVLVDLLMGNCIEKCVFMMCFCKIIVNCFFEVKNLMVMLIMFNEVNMKLIMDFCK